MRGTLALFASVGAGISLVAATALSLLTVSAVVAIGGWPGLATAAPRAALVVGSDKLRPVRAVVKRAVVMPKPVARPAPRPVVHAVIRPTMVHPAKHFVAAATPGIISRPASGHVPTPTFAPTTTTTKAIPQVGNGVRKLGDGLSSTLQKTGKALTNATAPISPPLSHAVDQIAQLVAALIKHSTQGLGGALDKVARPRDHRH